MAEPKKVIKKIAKKIPYVGTALTAASIAKKVHKIVKAKKAMVPAKGSKGYKDSTVNKVIKEKRVADNKRLAKGEPARKAAFMARVRKEVLNKPKKSYKTYVESQDAYGVPTIKPVGGKAKSGTAFVKKVEKKLGTTFSVGEKGLQKSGAIRTKAPWKASQQRKVNAIKELRAEVKEANRGSHPSDKKYALPRYKATRPKIAKTKKK